MKKYRVEVTVAVMEASVWTHDHRQEVELQGTLEQLQTLSVGEMLGTLYYDALEEVRLSQQPDDEAAIIAHWKSEKVPLTYEQVKAEMGL